MTAINSIISAFKKQYPERKVTKIFDYDDNIYLVEAVLAENDHNNPYFGFLKKANKIIGYSPISDLKKFNEIMKTKPLFKAGG